MLSGRLSGPVGELLRRSGYAGAAGRDGLQQEG